MSEPTAPRCPTCGNEGPRSGKSFCEVCGDFNDWDAIARASAAPPPPPPAPAESAPPQPAPSQSVSSQSVSSQSEAPQLDPLQSESPQQSPPRPNPPRPGPPRPAPPGSTPPPPAPSPGPRKLTQPYELPSTAPAAGPSSNGTPMGGRNDDAQERARALLVPLAEPDVAPVLPGRPEPPRPEVRPVVANQESGIVCWNCGVGNRSDRRFCRNCGVDLSAAPKPAAAPRPSLWQRIGRGRLIAIATALALAILGVAAFLLVPRLLNTTTEVAPASVTASAEDPQHPVSSAFDNNQNSWWGSGQTGNSAGQFLQVNFTRPIHLYAIRITPGTSPDANDRRENRPRQIDILVTDSSGKTTPFTVNLKDGGAQQFSTPVKNASQVRLTVRSAFIVGPDKELAIADLRFIGK